MSSTIYSVITGTGSYIPSTCIKNEDFLTKEFYGVDGNKLKNTNQEIVEKFLEITTIAERRYVSDDLSTSEIGYFAALEAIKAAGINKEDLDYVIFAHNFGDIKPGENRSDIVPSLAARVKHKLQIHNPGTVAYDILFGCPGWLQAVIQANYYIRSGDAKKILVVGAEVLSRVYDPYDRDSLLYADGAGAIILEAKESTTPIGIVAHSTRSDTFLYSQMLHMDKSFNLNSDVKDNLYLKMNGRRLYQYALDTVPQAIKECLEKSKTHIGEIQKVLIHQANGKMDDAILKRLFALYDIVDIPDTIMPMTIAQLGNSSVATLPTLLDLIMKGKLDAHQINQGDNLVFASVGAGMSINAMVYKVQ